MSCVRWIGLGLLCLPLAACGAGGNTELSRTALVAALKKGGNVLVIRHANAPATLPAGEKANADNPGKERQLDADGRKGAAGLGAALVRLKVPIAEVISSPAYRARETVKVAGPPAARLEEKIGDNAQSMAPISEAQAAWLRDRAKQLPATGNTVLVTHNPNLLLAFPDWGGTMAPGDMAVIGPGPGGAAILLGRIKIEDWPLMR